MFLYLALENIKPQFQPDIFGIHLIMEVAGLKTHQHPLFLLGYQFVYQVQDNTKQLVLLQVLYIFHLIMVLLGFRPILLPEILLVYQCQVLDKFRLLVLILLVVMDF
ncbi:hypothetical protein EBZ80_26120 [bacterium]|nr:hypothetical protein [bacterium]